MKRPSLRSLLRAGRRAAAFAALMLSSYALLAYVFLPVSWHHFQQRRPAGDGTVSYTAEAIPADPLNVALVGSREEVARAMRAAGWLPADRITLKSGWRDARSVLFNRSYPTAPVSTHFVQLVGFASSCSEVKLSTWMLPPAGTVASTRVRCH